MGITAFDGRFLSFEAGDSAGLLILPPTSIKVRHAELVRGRKVLTMGLVLMGPTWLSMVSLEVKAMLPPAASTLSEGAEEPPAIMQAGICRSDEDLRSPSLLQIAVDALRGTRHCNCCRRTDSMAI